MDVDARAVERAFRRAGVARMIHGHTHRPARHDTIVDGRPRERFVLSDWDDRGHYLEIDERGARHARNHRMTPEIFSAPWFSALASIIVIDLILAGDNALVIGLAARNVPAAMQGA